MAPPKYGDFSKIVEDIFGDDYTSDQTLKVKSKAGGLGFTVENTNKDSGVAGKVSLKYGHKSSGLSVDKLQLKPNGDLALEASMDKLFADGVKGYYKGGLLGKKKGESVASLDLKGKAGVDYKDKMVCSRAEVDVPDLNAVSLSAVVGYEDILVGASTKYSFKDSGLADYNVALGYKQKDWFASLASEDKLSKFKAAAFWNPCPPANVGAMLTYKPEDGASTLAVGTTYVCNPTTTVRVKADSDGMIAAAFAQKCGKNMTLVGSTETKVQDLSSFKYGASVTLG
mmetsp:Transcript_7409/g.9889  ORF Transcript_7409/g.9889 Transcript_7409/m.9889 type:complete len:284 (+) Transcript_7409:148-999(+)